MKKADLHEFIVENNLLSTINEVPGIYGITIDGVVVYIGQSHNMYERCSQHIYNIENAAFLTEDRKYQLLLAAKMGGHMVDCVLIKECPAAQLNDYERRYIQGTLPPLNKIVYGSKRQDVDNLKIYDLLTYVYKYSGEECVEFQQPAQYDFSTLSLLEEKIDDLKSLVEVLRAGEEIK